MAACSLLLCLPASAQTLREWAEMRRIRIGAAAQAQFLGEAAYTATLAREFNLLEPENEMKFGPIHPAREGYNFAPADRLVAFAESNRMAVRGHTLVWHNQVPAWVSNGNFSSEQLAQILEQHIATVVGRYAGKVYAWDVVNEAFEADGSLRATIWHNRPGIGREGARYIEQAFRWARAADPRAKLFYNDFGAEEVNAKSDAIYALARDFQARGVPIDGVGLQLHLTRSGINIAGLEANVRRLTELGLEVHLTELDVRLPLAAGAASAADLAAQARIYRDVVAVCLKYPLCNTVQMWGFTDRHSWVPQFFPGLGAALPFDENYRPKPAYDALVEALSTTPPVLAADGIVNGASYAGGAVAPGEIVTVFGVNFGPPSPAALQLDPEGRVATDLARARLLFDGVAAPLLYAVAGQVSAVAPFGLAGRAATQVQYEFRGVRSNQVTLPVVPASPALFTQDASGRGAGAILNSDFSLNTAGNPAERGGVVLLFGTGAGQTLPPSEEGQVTGTSLPRTARPVAARMGGLESQVLYAGGAPGLVAGVFQVNARVPPAVAPGPAVPVVVTVGTETTQPGVTLAVR
jgi:endo-1,4-beta-xylanase